MTGMGEMKKILIVSAVILFWASCTSRVSMDDRLDEVYMLTHSSPDSAWVVLNRTNKRELNEAQAMYYELLKIRINDLQDMNITADTAMLSIVKKYFEKHGQSEKLGWAYFYEGRINLENDNIEAAVWNFNKAIEYSGGDLILKSKSQSSLGYIYYTNQAFKDALNWYEKAYKTSLQNDFQSSIYSILDLGDIYLYLQKPDSALHYYNLAIELSETFENDSLRFDITQRTIVALSTAEEYSRAMDLCRLCYNEFDAKNDKEKEYFLATDLAVIFYHTDNPDSLLYYAKIAEQYAVKKDDLGKMVSTYQLLALGEEEKGNYSEALKYYKKYARHRNELAQKTAQHKVEEVQKKYDTEILENEKNQLVIAKQRRTIILIAVGVLSLLAIAFFISVILKHEGYILRLKETVGEQKKTVHKMAFDKVDMARRITILNNEILGLNLEKNHQIKLAFSDVAAMITPGLIASAINDIKRGYAEKFRLRFPQLDKEETDICFMILLGFSSKEIAGFFSVKLNTMQRRESAIRQKLEVETRGNIKQYVEKILGHIELRQ